MLFGNLSLLLGIAVQDSGPWSFGMLGTKGLKGGSFCCWVALLAMPPAVELLLAATLRVRVRGTIAGAESVLKPLPMKLL